MNCEGKESIRKRRVRCTRRLGWPAAPRTQRFYVRGHPPQNSGEHRGGGVKQSAGRVSREKKVLRPRALRSSAVGLGGGWVTHTEHFFL